MSVAWVQRYIEMRTPSIILQDTFNWNDTPFSIEFHWHMELFFEAVMLAVTEVFMLIIISLLAMWLQLWLRPEIASFQTVPVLS